ncbi:MAG TPA: toxin-antitoxin system HicB family antitoxin [Acetobacteraceae bacterium]
MKAPQASLATLDVLPAKGRAGVREAVPEAVAPPALPVPDPAVVHLPPARVGAVTTNLRLPPDVHHRLKVMALQSGVSLNALILDAILDKLDSRT